MGFMVDERAMRFVRDVAAERLSRRELYRRAGLLGISGAAVATALRADLAMARPLARRQDSGGKVVVWWNKSYYPQEDEALEAVIARWEEETGNSVELSYFTTEDLPKKILSAVEAGDPPDVAFAHLNDWQINPRLAWNGQLEDVSDVVTPMEAEYTRAALDSVSLFNNSTGERSYYAIPLEAQMMHIFYWKTLLAEADSSPEAIPGEWDDFWQFWIDIQNTLRDKGNEDVYALGLPVSAQATDTYFLLSQFLEAYDVQFIDADGNLRFDDEGVMDGIAKVLEWEAAFYTDDHVPPGAINWLDPDNNLNFINKTTVMTPNPSLSIPASQAEDTAVYFDEMATQAMPNGPDGNPLTYMVSIKSAIIFSDSKNKEGGKAFMSYLIQPEHLADYLKASLGRWFPVMPKVLEDTFWSGTDDPHIAAAFEQFKQETRPFQTALNPAYGEVLAQNVWGNALGSIIVGGASGEQAAEQAANQIKQIFERFEAGG
jgi:multiple sugar transport system substrate-binding protein